MVIFADFDSFDIDFETPREMNTKAIFYSPIGLPRRLEIQMKAYYRERMSSIEFFKIVSFKMIVGNTVPKSRRVLCYNRFIDLPNVEELGDDESVWEKSKVPLRGR